MFFFSYHIIIVTKSSTVKFENGGVKFALYVNLISPCGFTISNKMLHWACANWYF